MEKRKILYITGGRMDFGLMKQALIAIDKKPNLEIEIAVCGLHLMPEFGKTIEEVKKQGFKTHIINTIYQTDTKESMAVFLGETIIALTAKLKTIKPDMILLLGDRAEMLAGAIAGTYLSIPIAHVSGGDVSSTVDESVRHAITKLSHLHFPISQKSATRLIKMGEEKSRVFFTGSPGIDAIFKEKLLSKKDSFQKMGLDEKEKLCLLIQHPVTLEAEKSGWQMEKTMEAIVELKLQTIAIYPNADAGATQIIATIEKYSKEYPFIKCYKNLERSLFLSAMKSANVMLGNSSSGLIDTPTFHLPTINIGTRERGREQSQNVINVANEKQAIKQALQKALNDKNFKEKVKHCKSPYGNGKAGEKIADILSKITLDKKLLDKKLTY